MCGAIPPIPRIEHMDLAVTKLFVQHRIRPCEASYDAAKLWHIPVEPASTDANCNWNVIHKS